MHYKYVTEHPGPLKFYPFLVKQFWMSGFSAPTMVQKFKALAPFQSEKI